MLWNYHQPMADEMGDLEGVLMFDETGFVKKGLPDRGVRCRTKGQVPTELPFQIKLHVEKRRPSPWRSCSQSVRQPFSEPLRKLFPRPITNQTTRQLVRVDTSLNHAGKIGAG